MSNAELLRLHPQHLAELSSFLAGFDFDDVDIVASEKVAAGNHNLEPLTCDFVLPMRRLRFDNVFRGKDHMHAIFSDGENDNTFYCISYAHIGEVEERIIFKLTRI